MTLLDDPAVATPVAARPAVRRRRVNRWRFAVRLARREVRRRPGRTVLVMLLVAVPVTAMTVGSVLFRTSVGRHELDFRRSHGQADLALGGIVPEWDTDGPVAGSVARQITDLRRQLPEGSRLVEFASGDMIPVAVAGGPAVPTRFSTAPLGDPITAGMYELTAGRLPVTPDELLLSPRVADLLGLAAGDTVTLEQPEGTFVVTGIGRSAAARSADIAVVPSYPTEGPVLSGWMTTVVLVELPEGGAAPSAVGASLLQRGVPASTFEASDRSPWDVAGYTDLDEASLQPVAWGWVAGVLALAVFGIVVTAAFATSARRQLVTIGQLSANGAEAAVIRRTLALQGAWSALAGSALGIGLGLAGVYAARGRVESMMDHAVPGYVVAAGDLVIVLITGVVAGTVAALLPARSASRVSTLAALAGRRPLRSVPRHLVPLGAVLFVAGTAVLAFAAWSGGSASGASGDLVAAVALAGGVAVLAGGCCVAPAVVGAFGPLSDRAGGALRLAGRSLARTRTRTAAMVAATTAVAAFVLGGAAVAGSVGGTDSLPYLPDDVVVVRDWSRGLPGVVPGEVGLDDARDLADAAVTVESWRTLRSAIIPGAEKDVVLDALVADPGVLDLGGLTAADRDRLERDGLLSVDPYSVVIDGVSAAPAAVAALLPDDLTVGAAEQPTASAYLSGLLVTPAAADRLGWSVVQTGWIGRAAAPFDQTDRDRLAAAALSVQARESVWGPVEPGNLVSVPQLDWGAPAAEEIRWLLPALLAGGFLLVLLVVTIGLALSAAESRDEHEVLLAIGASPRAIRRVASSKALLVAASGAVLAVPLGLVPVAAVVSATGDTVAVPWAAVGVVVLVIPGLVAALGWLASATAQRLRPGDRAAFSAD